MLKQIKELFYLGGSDFMVALTILLIIIIAWLTYHFVLAYYFKEVNIEKALRKLGYGKTMGLFTLVFGICGSMLGFYTMFEHIEYRTENGMEIMPEMIYFGIRLPMIVIIYGLLIYLFSLLFWYIAITLIKKKQLVS